MKKVKSLWMPVLLGTLLMSALVGVAGAGPNARPEASPALENHMIGSDHCVAATNVNAWAFTAGVLWCPAGPPCQVVCPIKPPHEGLIRVQRLALYAWDNTAGQVCIWLVQAYPKSATIATRISNQCTVNSVLVPQVYAYNPANFKVSQLQDLYVLTTLTDTAVSVYGFKLRYEPL